MFPDIVGIVGGKAENLIFHKQKVVKIRLGIAIVSEKFRTVVVDFHADHALQIFDIRGIDLGPVGMAVQGDISSLPKIFDDTLCRCQHSVFALFLKGIMFRNPVRLRQTKTHQMVIFSSRQLDIQLRSRKQQEIIPVQFRMNPVNPVIRQCQKIIALAAVMLRRLFGRMHPV